MITASEFFGGSGTILDSTAIGDQVTYTVPNVAARTYHVLVGVKSFNNREIWQLVVAPAGSTSFINHGPPADEYNISTVYYEIDVGTFSIATLFGPGNPGRRSCLALPWAGLFSAVGARDGHPKTAIPEYCPLPNS